MLNLLHVIPVFWLLAWIGSLIHLAWFLAGPARRSSARIQRLLATAPVGPALAAHRYAQASRHDPIVTYLLVYVLTPATAYFYLRRPLLAVVSATTLFGLGVWQAIDAYRLPYTALHDNEMLALRIARGIEEPADDAPGTYLTHTFSSLLGRPAR